MQRRTVVGERSRSIPRRAATARPRQEEVTAVVVNNNNNNTIRKFHLTSVQWLLLLLLLLLSCVTIMGGIRNNLSISFQEMETPQNSVSNFKKAQLSSNYNEYEYESEYADSSPVCRPSFLAKNNNNNNNKNPPRTIRRLFLGHMRKAGGSTLRAYFGRVAQKYNLKLIVAEATKFELAQKRNDTLYITHLRDPIARAISHYKYEGRWSCDQLVGRNTNTNTNANANASTASKNQSSHPFFVATKENSVDLKTWMESDRDSSSSAANDNNGNGNNGTCNKHNKKTGWKCASNCYIRWLNFPHGFCTSREQLLQLPFHNSTFYRAARDKLFKFHLVLDMDKLFQEKKEKNIPDAEAAAEYSDSSSYAKGLERLFGVRGLLGLKQNMYCGPQAKRANKNVPLVIENETLAELYRRNRPDHALYKEVTSCGKEGIVFPNHVLSDFLV
jgi:hypothetical protein